MSDEDKDSKSELPTEKKITDTIEKGNVPFSKEVTNAASILGMIFVGYMSVPWFITQMGNNLSGIFANLGNWPLDTPQNAASLINIVGKNVIFLLAPIILPMVAFGLVSSISQNKPSMVLNRIAPKLSKVSLLKGLKRLLGRQGVREFGKALFKFSAAGTVAAVVVISESDTVISQMLVDTINIPVSIHDLLLKILIGLFFTVLILAAADFVWVRKDWVDDIKMSHQEIKDERKQSEGDPIVKMRNRSIARDRSRRRMIKEVEKATIVITNPTHFAVAMRYDPTIDKAPFVLAKGQDIIALKIREVAESNNIPITEDPPLARALYKIAQVDSEVPPEFFVPLANIIRALSKSNSVGYHG
ncbi:MAG: flagellar biosynthesis protein FlhB [Hyphomicrobiales bacterium]|nr:flagellar biosynthesis protein FlhB [Hyphomicrobiales bacterium]